MTANTALYARVSGDAQVKEQTIESQLEALREYAKTHGYEIDEDLIFVEKGVSGGTLERPALDALRDKALTGQIDQIIILCPDRLTRELAHQFVLIEEFRRLGVRILFTNRTTGETVADQLVLNIEAVFAEYERKMFQERSRRGKIYKAKKGDVGMLARAPYGYIYVPKKLAGAARYEIHPEESEVVKKIFHQLGHEQQSIQAIVRKLNAEGIPPRRSTRWVRSSVFHILKNPAYMGQAAYRKTQTVFRQRPTKRSYDQGFYPKKAKSSCRPRPPEDWLSIPVPAIISPELFERVQTQLQENKRLAARNTKYPYLLTGLLRCQACGYAIYGRTRKINTINPTRRSYYRCKGQDGTKFAEGRQCASHSIRIEVLDELVWEHVHKLLLQPELVLEEYLERLQVAQHPAKSPQALLKQHTQEIRHQNAQKERLLNLYQLAAISLEDIQPRLERIRLRIKELEQKCQELDQECQQVIQLTDWSTQFMKFRTQLGTNLKKLTFDQKKAIIRLVVQEILVNPQNQQLAIKHTIPLAQTNGKLCPGHSYTRGDIK